MRPRPKIELELTEAMDHHRAGRLTRAETLYRRALSADPRHPKALYSFGVLALQTQRNELAAELLGSLSEIEPENVACHNNLGEAYRRLGRRLDAVNSLMRALSLNPDFAEGFYNLALVLRDNGELRGAVVYFERAADLKPDEFRFQVELASALHSIGAPGRAVGHYHCALVLAPRSVETLLSLSGVLLELGRTESAISACQRALKIDPDSALAHASLAAALFDQQKHEESVTICSRAIEIDPSVWQAHFQLGNALVGRGEIEAALECYRRTIALRPAQHVAHSNLVFLLSYVPGVSAEAIGKEAKAWAEQHAAPLAPAILEHSNDRARDRRLRIGYVSPDFRDHAVASFVLPLLEHHDGAGYEAICYSSARHPDLITERLRVSSDGWRDVTGVGDAEVADLVRSDGIDVLVNLAMHSGGGRPLLFARKPAPVQICWLAYVGTTGLSTMDYRVTDPYLEPPGVGMGWCAETPLQLPDTFWCYEPLEPAPHVNELPALSSGQVTFGSQHSFHKIHVGVLALWARVLRSVEGSRLVMHAPEKQHAGILEIFEQKGVSSSRIEFLPRRPRNEYLCAYHRIDVSLDTFPYNGATTSLDAWHMGVPVLSLLGQTPVGRAGLSIASNLGLPEVIATSEDDYVKAAVNLTGDLSRLSALRAGLRDRMTRSPLMDGPRFARNLENAYRYAWTTWCESNPTVYHANTHTPNTATSL